MLLNSRLKLLISEKLAALEKTVKEADDALLAKIERLQADLDAAYKLADEMVKKDIDALLAKLEADHKADIDALRAEPETLKSQIAQQDEINDTVIQTLKSVDNTQQEAMDISRLLTIIGLCIGSVSFLGNAALLVLLLKKKFLTK